MFKTIVRLVFPMALLGASALPVRADILVLPTNSTIAGQTIGEWSAAWWQWALSFSVPNDPFTDATGVNANLNQSGPIFFLAGNPTGPSNRSFSVPEGRYLLVPLLNGELSQLEIGFNKTAAEVRQAAQDQADLIDSLNATIDGVAVPNLFGHREVSPDFQFVAAANNAFGVSPGNSGIAVADGYFLMLAPPSPGAHVINFGGGVSSVGFFINDTDTITVVPEPGSLALMGVGLVGLLGGAVWRRQAAAANSRVSCPVRKNGPAWTGGRWADPAPQIWFRC